MTPEYYTDLLKVYARYARNYNRNRRCAASPSARIPQTRDTPKR